MEKFKCVDENSDGNIFCCECHHQDECPDSDAIREDLNPENKVVVEKITDEEMDMMDDQLNAEIENDIAAQRYLRDNTSDVQLIAFCNTKIEELKARRV